MDPFRRKTALDLVKVSSLLVNNSSSSSSSATIDRLPTSYSNINTTYPPSETEEQMPTVAPPAYHTIVDTNMPMPNTTSPYDALPREGANCNPSSLETSDDDDTPEITINAGTQVRGHGNIISITQMDSVRIANLISTVLSGDDTSSSFSTCNSCNDAGSNADIVGDGPITPPMPTSLRTSATREHTSTTRVRGVKRWCNINITVNCGATIIGDRNIVGPGLGDIARQMQIAQRNQAALLAQQRQQAAAAMGQAQRMPSPNGGAMPSGGLYHPVNVTTPPMSRSSSLDSDAGVGGGKRKREDGGELEGVAQKRRC